MLTELLHQKNCKNDSMVSDLGTGEIACSNCGVVSLEKIINTAAAINLASVRNNEKITLMKISEASGISAVTIRNRSKEINEILGDEING